MKKLFTLVLLFTVFQNFSQETLKPSDSLKPATSDTENTAERTFSLRPVSRIYFIFPQQFGDHALADAHDTSWGFGTSMSFIRYADIRFSIGLEFSQYSVSDASKVGNFNFSNNKALHFALSYDLKVNNTIQIAPYVAYGLSQTIQRARSERHATYDGELFRLGAIADYSLHRHMGIFVGIHYINTTFDIDTNPSQLDYFAKSQQLQLTLGLKFH